MLTVDRDVLSWFSRATTVSIYYCLGGLDARSCVQGGHSLFEDVSSLKTHILTLSATVFPPYSLYKSHSLRMPCQV